MELKVKAHYIIRFRCVLTGVVTRVMTGVVTRIVTAIVTCTIAAVLYHG
jgi:hypothetical protein